MGDGEVGQIFSKIQNLGNRRGVFKNIYAEVMKRNSFKYTINKLFILLSQQIF